MVWEDKKGDAFLLHLHILKNIKNTLFELCNLDYILDCME